MAIMNARFQKKGDAGGGGIGSSVGGILGAVGGAIAAPFTAGASLLPSIAAGLGVGSTVGGIAGGAVAPAKAAQASAPPEAPNSMQRRLAEMSQPQDMGHSQVLEESLKAISQADDATKQQYAPSLAAAYLKSMRGNFA